MIGFLKIFQSEWWVLELYYDSESHTIHERTKTLKRIDVDSKTKEKRKNKSYRTEKIGLLCPEKARDS